MEDKEVGELWREFKHTLEWPKFGARIPAMPRLIRKLVEERAERDLWNHPEGCRCECHPNHHLHSALRDFGIDPKDFT